MTSKIKLIRNNIFTVTTAQIFSLFLNMVTFGLVARILSIEDFGTFNYLLAIIGFSAKFIDLGVNPIVLRETAKTNNFSEYLGSVLFIKSLLLFCLLIIMNAYFFFAEINLMEKILLNLFTMNIFFSNKYTNIRELLVIPFKVKLRMEFPMILVLVDNFLLFVFSLFLKPSENVLIYFGMAYVVVNIPSTILLFVALKKKGFVFNYSNSVLKLLLKMSLPIYGYVLLMVIYSQADTLFLGLINGEKPVALYSTAIRLSSPFMLFASAITVTFFPIIVKKIKEKEDISKIVSSILKMLIIFSSTISLFVFFHSKDIITIVFGEKYIESSVALKYLSISIVFLFVNFFLVDLFTALNKQKLNFKYGILINLISIPLYIIVLPNYSFIGASIIKLSAIFLGSIFFIYRLVNSVKIEINYMNIIGWLVINIIFFYLVSGFKFYWLLIPEGIFIVLSTFLLNVFDYNELFKIFSMFNKEKLLSKITFLVRR